MEPLRILLVDDSSLFRKGLLSLLSSREDMLVVGEAGDGLEAIEKVRELLPDLILMDINMPRCNGIEATRHIKEELPYATVIMLTVSDDDHNLFDAIKNGARGYLLKNMEPDDLFNLLEGVSRGEAPISRMMATKILNEFAIRARKPTPVASPGSVLTPREMEVLRLVTAGMSNKEIASNLIITENTVKNHLRNILEKLHLQNRVQVAAHALREGMLDDDKV
ncbi:MAG: response regulator transcription factor [Dehalococcoidia bacterium]|nr:response regulator transcription factor [Dehalococcoidia bacterium]